MAKKKYDIKKLPFPIRPGETVYFVLDGNRIEPDIATSVGIDEDGKLLVVCGQLEYEIGYDDKVFILSKDAEKFMNDPASISDDYGVVDYKELTLPYYPGTTFYYCNYDGLGQWEIFEEYYTYVYFDLGGEIRVGDGDSECTVAGENVDPCFDTLRKAQSYIQAESCTKYKIKREV